MQLTLSYQGMSLNILSLVPEVFPLLSGERVFAVVILAAVGLRLTQIHPFSKQGHVEVPGGSLSLIWCLRNHTLGRTERRAAS